jgi:radical SAM/Cys-rich protein
LTVLSLVSRGSALADPARQVETLEAADLSRSPFGGDFGSALGAPLRPGEIGTLQLNLGKLCNMTCRHCHVDAGPDRTESQMSQETAEACIAFLDRTGAGTVDLTGGAPELAAPFRFLVDEAVARGKSVIDRCNLTVLLSPGQRGLPEWLAERGVELICSLPDWRMKGTDLQRGDGTFARSIEAMRLLNAAGYGAGDPRKRLTLISNPTGAFVPASQCAMEREWKASLERDHGVRFDRLLVLTNMPISRTLDELEGTGSLATYLDLLVRSFSPATVCGLMCKTTLSVGWDGTLYDCDFNQMLGLSLRPGEGGLASLNVRTASPEDLGRRVIITGRHCFGCTAGAGSSCGGAITRG